MAEKQFRCADVGYTECDWRLEGNSEDEMLPQIESHALQVHHLELKDEAIAHVKKAIQPVARAADRRLVGLAASDCYTGLMLDESDFRRYADVEVEALKQSLIKAEVEGGFEVEENNGAMNIVFEEPPSKFVVTPNTPIRQIWISALATSFKLEWSEAEAAFILPKTGERLLPLTARLINQHLGLAGSDQAVVLG